MKEWDRDGDGELSKIEFKQAVRLSLALKASNEQIDAIFDMIDVNGDASVGIESEARPLVKKVFEETTCTPCMYAHVQTHDKNGNEQRKHAIQRNANSLSKAKSTIAMSSFGSGCDVAAFLSSTTKLPPECHPSIHICTPPIHPHHWQQKCA